METNPHDSQSPLPISPLPAALAPASAPGAVPPPPPAAAFVKKEAGKKPAVWVYWVVIALLAFGGAIVTGLAVYEYSEASDLESALDYNRSVLDQTRASEALTRSELAEANQQIDAIGRVFPMDITNIEIASVDYENDFITQYGRSIWSYETKYLKPRITYNGLVSGNKTLKVKWYSPSGSLQTGLSSPSGCTFSQTVYISEAQNQTISLKGWGSNTYGNWRSGTYRLEIWYENVCLKAKTFTIY